MSELLVERLTAYSEADAAGIGRLMPYLSDQLPDDPIDEELMEDIILSPYHDLIVARLEGKIVGTATMNLLMGPGLGREGYLEDFVADPEISGQGIGDRVWDAMLAWCVEQGVDFGFTSRPERVRAHRFYLRHGAEVRPTTVFHVEVDR